MGPARSTPDLVLSVPEPDISLHLLIQLLKILNQAPNSLIQLLAAGPFRSPAVWHFSSKIIALAPSMNLRAKSQQRFASDRLYALRYGNNHNKTNLQSEP
jgi:hypothetical protein